MSDQMNAPMSPSTGIASWFSIWMEAVTKPSEQTYVAMVERPEATTNTAYLWVFIAGTISWFIQSLIGMVLSLVGFTLQSSVFSQLGGTGSSIGVSLAITVCGAPIVGGLSVLGLIINAGIVQWIAKMFGGTGTFAKLVYASAAISVPFTLVSVILSPFSAIPVLGICTGLISLVVSIYAVVLQVTAVKGINNFGWGQALGSVFIPVIVFACCLIGPIAVMRLLGPKIGNTFSSINNSLP